MQNFISIKDYPRDAVLGVSVTFVVSHQDVRYNTKTTGLLLSMIGEPEEVVLPIGFM